MSAFGGTVIGGIQDISALLPLLGTEQCEEHVGSALDKGFLYSAVTPVSIFGSLGIVRAAFNILIASLSIRRYRILGAKKLDDGGFSSKGVVAPMIALDREHPKRFLAESRLEAMLADEHIENVEDLTVLWGPKIFRWNIMLVLSTIGFSALGLLPYLVIILDSRHPNGRPLFPSGWGFPILRILGSALCVNVAQFIIQMRVLVILKTRLLFITINRLAKAEDIDIESKIKAEKYKEKERKHPWNPDVTSETCIWSLERWISSQSTIDTEAASEKATIGPFYESERKRHFDTMKRKIPFWLHPLLCLCLVIGIVMTVGGYIGCFYLIQHASTTSAGPVVWLALEALLSVLRIIIWALNPSWDDSKGVVFELKLASHAPLISCNKYQKDIEGDGMAPVTRSNSFLEEVVAYKGPLPLFSWNDVALYYIFTAKDQSPSITDFPNTSMPHGVLYIILFDYKEQTSRLVFKKGNTFLLYICSLQFAPGNTTINVKVNLSEEGITQLKTHSFTANTRFMEELTAHYDTVASLLQKRSRSNNLFGKTWALLHPEEHQDGHVEREDVDAAPVSLTKEDRAYLRQGQLERRWKDLFRSLEGWTEIYIALVIKELLQDVPIDLVFKTDESVTLVQKYEANEVEYLLIGYRIYMERLLMSTAKKWDDFVYENHNSMVKSVLSGTFVDTAEQHGAKIRKGRLETRLVDEWKWLCDTETRAKELNRQNRLDSQTRATEQRIQGRKYYDRMGDTISNTWKELLGRIVALGPMLFPSDNLPTFPTIQNNESVGSGDSSGTLAEESGDPFQAGVDATKASDIVGFKAEMEIRLKQGDGDLTNMPSDRTEAQKAKKDVFDDFELMKKRCRDRVDLLESRMNHQLDEFDDLSRDIRTSTTLDEINVLTSDTQSEATYWSNPSVQERRRLMERNQHFLELTDATIAALGGVQNAVRALKRSQPFAYIDFSQTEQLTGDDALQIVKSVKSLTGVFWAGGEKEEEITDAVLANVASCFAKEHFACFYRYVNVTDYYRKGRPYLLFQFSGASSCTILFEVHEERDHILRANHCMTTSYGVVDIALNDGALERTWGLPTSRAIDDFYKEDVFLPRNLLKFGETNELTITLADTSPGAYWLSDLSLSAAPIPTS